MQTSSQILKALLTKPQPITFRTLQRETGISPRILKKHLDNLEKNDYVTIQIDKEWNLRSTKIDNRPRLISITEGGKNRLFEQVTLDLSELTQSLKVSVDHMSRIENVWRWNREGKYSSRREKQAMGELISGKRKVDPKAPATISLMSSEEVKEMFEHHEKVFGNLRDVFFDLAKVVMKIDVGFVDAEEDLDNVTIRFRGGRAVWSVDAGVRPQTHITISDKGDVFPVDMKEFEAAKVSGKVKSWEEFRKQKIRERAEILEQLRKKRAENSV